MVFFWFRSRFFQTHFLTIDPNRWQNMTNTHTPPDVHGSGFTDSQHQHRGQPQSFLSDIILGKSGRLDEISPSPSQRQNISSRHTVSHQSHAISIVRVWRFNSKTLRFPPRWIQIKETAQSILHFSGHQAIFDLQQLHYNNQAPTSCQFFGSLCPVSTSARKSLLTFSSHNTGSFLTTPVVCHGKKVSYLPRIRLDKAMWFSIPALVENHLT